MNAKVNNNADNIISRMMEARPSRMEGNIHLQTKGMLKSRTVTIGDGSGGLIECSLDQLISGLGQRIKRAEVGENAVELGKLKHLLKAVSSVEKKDRGVRAKLLHIFSKRDAKIQDLDKAITDKIEKDHALKGIKEAINVSKNKKISDLYTNGNELIDEIRVTWPTSVQIWHKEVKVQFYMKKEGDNYQMALKDPVMRGTKALTTEEVLDLVNGVVNE